MNNRRVGAVACVFVLAVTSIAKAVDGDFSLSLGYAHLKLEGSESFANRDGFRMEPRVSFAFFDQLPQLRLGFGLGISGYTHELDTDTIITIDNGSETDVIFADQFEGISLLEPEFQISWRQAFGQQKHWYVEPGVGLGWAFANYYVASDWWWDDELTSEWDSTYEVRPFLRAGYQGEGWLAGLEASYMFGGNIDLTDQVHGDLNELYIGGFWGIRW